MTFSSFAFLVFFAIVYSIILIFNVKPIRNKIPENIQLKLKHSILLISSYVFYGWWDFRFCFLMALLTIIAWYCARQIDNGSNIKLFMVLGVAAPLITLGFFKYFNFFLDSFTSVFGIENAGTLNIILPVGISFYTFQSMSYTIDVYRKKLKAHSLMDVALYVSFFPQLVAGPIVKAQDFLPQLKSNHKLTLSDFAVGIQIFMIGMFKKLVIADNISVFVDDVFAKPLAFSSITVILAAISYSIQIYCDFSGYSDMAIGTAKCFGYNFKKNFNIPFLSKNVTELWKRWHISLSSWLQEYLYIGLGGNRKGKIRTYVNLLLTMVIGGFWHGANYTFILWGFMHGVALIAHKIFSKNRKGKKSNVITTTLSVTVTFAYTALCFVVFRAENIRTAIEVIYKIFVPSSGITQIFSWAVIAIIILTISHIIAIIHSKKLDENRWNGFYPILDLTKITSLIIFITFVGITFALAYTNANPFIYFQF